MGRPHQRHRHRGPLGAARRLLHDQTLAADDRVAGLLVLLYAQWPSTVSRLTIDHVDANDGQVRLRLGDEPIVLPEPLADLVLGLVATRRGHAALADQGTSKWLFPGGMPGRRAGPHARHSRRRGRRLATRLRRRLGRLRGRGQPKKGLGK